MENIVSVFELSVSPWQSALEYVRQHCSDFGDVFFDAVGYEGYSDGVVCLTVPDNFRKTWLESHYGSLLREAFAAVLGSDFREYVIRELSPMAEKAPVMKLSAPVIPKVVRRAEPVRRTQENLKLYAAYTFDTFIEGECNSIALRVAKMIAEKPGEDPQANPLVVYGASGLGKTHLLQAVAHRILSTRPDKRVVYRQAYDFLRDYTSIYEQNDAASRRELQTKFRDRYETCDVLILDDIQLLEKAQKTQEALFLLIKYMQACGKQVVLSCDRAPSDLPRFSTQLLERLTNSLCVGLGQPDLNTRLNLISKKSERLPFAVQDREEICRFLSIPPRENFRFIEGILNWLDAMHTLNGVILDLDCVKRLLASTKDENEAPITLKSIAETVAFAFKVEPIALASKRQDVGASIPRKVAMFLCRELTQESLKNVGEYFNRDYATVIAAINSLKAQMEKDVKLFRQVEDIRYMLEA